MSMTMLENGDLAENDEDDDTVSCYHCGDDVHRDDVVTVDDEDHCQSCASDYHECANCSEMTHYDDLAMTADGDVCSNCNYDYSDCRACDERIHCDHMVTVNYDESVCESCRDNYYSCCENCGEYYADDNGPCCPSDCSCEAPRQSFSFPSNGGTDTISNDERVEINLSAGIIDPAGMNKIYRLVTDAGRAVYNEAVEALHAEGKSVYDMPSGWEGFNLRDEWYHLACDIEADKIGNEWQGQRGNFTRRLRRYAYNEYKIALPDSLITEIGNVARAQSQGTDVKVEFTRDLNQSASDFFHEDSCWWTDYAESRCALKSNGGIGLRTFGSVTYPVYGYQIGPWANHHLAFKQNYVEMDTRKNDGVVTGRAWVMPVKQGEIEQRSYDHAKREFVTKMIPAWVPTFDSTTPDGYIVFNGYGDLENYAPARIVAEMTGMTYAKVGFDCDPMYINAGGYLVSSKGVIADLDNRPHITLRVDAHSNLHTKELANVAA